MSAWASWESIVFDYLSASGDTKKLQVVYNTAFGELWEDRGDIMDEDELLARRELYDAELPEGVLLLTAGVDTQDDRMEYEIVGHGHFGETWGIERGIILGRPDTAAVWRTLDERVFDRVLHFKDGLGLRMSLTFVDEGGHFTQDVREQCNKRIQKKVFAIKGMPGPDKPYTAPPKKMKIVRNGKVVGSCWQYQIGVDAGKQIVMDNLKVQTPGSKYCHFPKRDDYGPAYFKGLLSEHLEYNVNKKQPWEWVKIPGHERNETLDIRNYNMAAVKALSPDMDAIERKIRKARGEKIAPAPAVAAPKPPKKKTSKRSKNYLDEDW